MSNTVRELLQNKDKNFDRFIPDAYQMSAEEKRNELFLTTMNTQFELRAAAKCIKPCFSSFDGPSVSQNESDCMTNCTSKALETLTTFQLNYKSLQQ